MGCKSLDEQFVRLDFQAQELQRQFVCVRLVQMKGVDLSLFQFDWDLTWHVFVLNADGTIYGRFGTRDGSRNNQLTHVSLAAFKKAMTRALALHGRHAGVKASLTGKRGPNPAYRVPEDAPELKKFSGPTTAQNCIHCHMAGESALRIKRRERRLEARDIWPYPLPENLGMKMDREDDLRVQSVFPGSAAQRAGLLTGDELANVNGQPLISQADFQWILHYAPDEGTLDLRVQRNGSSVALRLELQGPWRKRDRSWSDTAWGLRPGVQFETLSQSARRQAGMPSEGMALRVRYAFREAAQAGLRTGDIVTAADGQTSFPTEQDFLAWLHLRKPPPDSVNLTIRRRDQTLELSLPVER